MIVNIKIFHIAHHNKPACKKLVFKLKLNDLIYHIPESYIHIATYNYFR